MQKTGRTGFAATFYQVKFAYQLHFGADIPAGMTYEGAANALVRELGHDAAMVLMQGVENNARNPYPLDA